MNIKPLQDNVVIEPVEKDEKTNSGILLPQTAEKGSPEQGKVVAVGLGKIEKGQRVPVELKVGDVVLFSQYSPNEVKVEGKKYLIIKQDDILAILEQ